MDHKDAVERAKAFCEQNNINILGSCGAFSILIRTALDPEVQAEGYGLVAVEDPHTNCLGFSTDKLMKRDNTYIDCLISAGGEGEPPRPGTGNIPAWQEQSGPIDLLHGKSRWRDPSDVVISGPGLPPELPPAPPGLDIVAVLHAIAVLDDKVTAFRAEAKSGFAQAANALTALKLKAAPTYKGIAVATGKVQTLKPQAPPKES